MEREMISTAIKFINLWSLSDLKAWRDWASHPVWKNWKSRLLNNYNAKKFVNLCRKGNYLTFWQLHLWLFTYLVKEKLLSNSLTFSFQDLLSSKFCSFNANNGFFWRSSYYSIRQYQFICIHSSSSMADISRKRF